MNTVPSSPCQDRIEMAVRDRARSILRRLYSSTPVGRFTAEDSQWLRHNLPQVITDNSLERALRLAGPDFDKATGRYISEFYEPDEPSRVREYVLAALAIENVEDIRQ
jgi:hypothetical protein